MIRTAWARAGLLLQPQALGVANGVNGSRLLSSSSVNCAVTIHKQKLENVKITSEPNEFNSLSKEDMANIRQDLVRYGHEPWYDKKRGIYVNRAPRHEQDVCIFSFFFFFFFFFFFSFFLSFFLSFSLYLTTLLFFTPYWWY